MSLNAREAAGGGGGNSRILEPASYPGRLVHIIGLGLQAQRPFQGQEKDPRHEILLTYELSDEFLQDEDGNDLEDKPIFISERMPLHNLSAERAKSTARYMALDANLKYDG